MADENANQGGEDVTYTVQSGDTLAKIAREYYGNDGHYMRIFEANRDQLDDPDQLKAGQTLKIPPAVS